MQIPSALACPSLEMWALSRVGAELLRVSSSQFIPPGNILDLDMDFYCRYNTDYNKSVGPMQDDGRGGPLPSGANVHVPSDNHFARRVLRHSLQSY